MTNFASCIKLKNVYVNMCIYLCLTGSLITYKFLNLPSEAAETKNNRNFERTKKQ